VKALVTGGAGFIGSHIVDLLLADGHDVAVVDNLSTGKRENLASGACFYALDIVDASLRDLFLAERPEVIYHEAAQMSVKASTEDPVHDARINVVGLLNVLQAAVAARARKIVFASSGATYGNPIYLPIDEKHPQRPESPYGITKMVAEHYLKYFALDYGLAFTSLRYGNVYGPRQDSQGYGEAGVIGIFIRKLLDGQTPTIYWDGEQTRDYVFVTDVARANVLAATAGDGECLSIGTGAGTSVNQIVRLLCESMELIVTPRYGPRRPGDLRDAYFDWSRARDVLGWKPLVSLPEGIRRTVESIRAERMLEVVGGTTR
jgi:UDP-glucose 4-epimerase